MIQAMVLRMTRTEKERKRRHLHGDTGAKFRAKLWLPREDGCSNTISTSTNDNLLIIMNESRKDLLREINNLKDDEVIRIRKFTPRECFRLMGVCETDIDKIYASGVSKSQMYKMAGNSIVVDCMYYMFRNLFHPEVEKPKAGEQLTLF